MPRLGVREGARVWGYHLCAACGAQGRSSIENGLESPTISFNLHNATCIYLYEQESRVYSAPSCASTKLQMTTACDVQKRVFRNQAHMGLQRIS